jgi:hypothetical protein
MDRLPLILLLPAGLRLFSLAGLSTASEKKTSLSVLSVSAVKYLYG